MSPREISLDEDAYDRLEAHKRDGETYSDVIVRLTEGRSWRSVAGIWDDGTELDEFVSAARRRSRRRSKAIADALDVVRER